MIAGPRVSFGGPFAKLGTLTTGDQIKVVDGGRNVRLHGHRGLNGQRWHDHGSRVRNQLARARHLQLGMVTFGPAGGHRSDRRGTREASGVFVDQRVIALPASAATQPPGSWLGYGPSPF